MAVTVTETDAAGIVATPTMAAVTPPRTEPVLPPALAEALRVADETSRSHAQLLAEAERLLAELGPDAVLRDRRVRGPGELLAKIRTDPPVRMVFQPFTLGANNCQLSATPPAPAFLVDYNDHLAIYQDSAQQASAGSIRQLDARRVLDYYDAYGANTIAHYFGGVSDIDENGRVNVLVSPVVPSDLAAFVSSINFYEQSSCFGSNEMELVYYNKKQFDRLANDESYQVFGTMVHEVKHVSSLYRSMVRGRYQPSWAEEGTAEIAKEIASRKAMEAVGGVAQGARLNRLAFPTTHQNYGVFLNLLRMSLSYTQEVNSLTGDPNEDHTYYGTSWHFHRFLGDVYGNARGKADGSLFRALNDTTASPGADGIKMVTGKEISVLLEEYAAAMMLNGIGVSSPQHDFTTYDFPSALEVLSWIPGRYPWPQTGSTPVTFDSRRYKGNLAPAGIRMYDFQSDGSGFGIEVEVSVPRAPANVRVVIARIR